MMSMVVLRFVWWTPAPPAIESRYLLACASLLEARLAAAGKPRHSLRQSRCLPKSPGILACSSVPPLRLHHPVPIALRLCVKKRSVHAFSLSTLDTYSTLRRDQGDKNSIGIA